MTRTIAYCALLIFFGLVCAASLAAPGVLSDRNPFLKSFISGDLLAMLAVIVSITLASTSALHLEFNKIEERYGRRGLHRSRAGVRQAAYFLIALLVAGAVLVVTKTALPLNDHGQAFFNGVGLFILFWNVLILISITQAVFAIAPNIPAEGAPEDPTT